jgi:type VI secretion system protein VasG
MINVDLRALIAKLNKQCLRALEGASGMCLSRGNYEVAIEHVLIKLLEEPGGDFQLVLRHFGIDPAGVQKGLQRSVERLKSGNPRKPVFSTLLLEWFEEAWMIASIEFGAKSIRSGHLVGALVSNPNRYAADEHFDEVRAISPEALRKDLSTIVAHSVEEPAETRVGAAAEPAAMRGAETALGKFTIDFTGRARAGEIDPVFCRDREIRQMIDILGRRRKNNPIVVGEAGVGKTAVVEGLALKVVQDDVPDVLKGVDIYGLDMGLLQAGASVRGEFEQRLKSVIEEVKSSPKPIVLFIDEAHTLIGAGGPAGGGDAANLLKPALARGEMRTIAATTWSEYKKYFEKDAALARRFQLVKVDEPSVEEASEIIRGLRKAYEDAHGVYVRDDAVMEAARLSARYISGRQLPDKAVDLLDTACARVKISLSSKPDSIDDRERRIQSLERELAAVRRDVEAGNRADDGAMAELERKIREVEDELESLRDRWEAEKVAVSHLLELRRAMRGEPASSASEDRMKEEEIGAGGEATPEPAVVSAESLREKIAEAEHRVKEIQGTDPLVHFEVGPDVIGRVVSDWTGVPVGKMVRDEAKTTLGFAERIRARIKGQDHAVDAISRGLRASKAGLGNPRAPIGVFLFVGPSGVGKTETGLAVADLLFGGERFVTTINMSEFQEKHTVSRLIGSPPGYVGFGEGGVLTESVRQRPYSVVLLDEVEKADLEVMNLFYQVFDKGMLSDGEGRVIDFKNTLIFMTSNLGSDVISQMCAGERPPPETILEAVRPMLSAHFKPALLARMEVVPFYPLSPEALSEIVELKLHQLRDRLKSSQRIDFTYRSEVVQQIVARCTEVETGARNVDHIVQQALLPRISTEILERMAEERMPESLEVGIAKDGGFFFRFAEKEKE